MNQDTSAKATSPETRKKILLGTLFLVLCGVLYLQFSTGGGDRPSSVPVASGSPASQVGRPARPSGTPGSQSRTVPIVSLPLDLVAIAGRLVGKAGSNPVNGRNIFVYPTPTPPPPPKPEPPPPPLPPPPISLDRVSPSGVIARTGDFTVTVFGSKIPADGQLQIEGRPLKTNVISDTEAQATVTAEMIRNGGTLNITVRSSADSSLYSSQVSINVAEPPTPLYRYIGLIVTRQRKLAVVKELDGEQGLLNLIENQTFNCNKATGKCKWKLTNINPQRLIIEDLDLRITHTVNYTGESGDERQPQASS